jgi:hypothetical protein
MAQHTKIWILPVYHANSVLTSSQFIRSKSLLSRGNTERLNLKQTDQNSDEIDKRYSVWFDVFVDSVDIHARASRANHYGPVLFVLDLGLIKRTNGRIWVTKLNPTKWTGTQPSERWFQSKADLRENFVLGNFDHMIVFRHCGGALPFGNSLQEIVIDDPRLEVEGLDLYSVGIGALFLAMSDVSTSIPIRKRECVSQCRCRKTYKNSEAKTCELFIPT